jgi:hypothetical protein
MLGFSLEAPAGFEPAMEVLQTSALPLGYGTKSKVTKSSVSYDPNAYAMES